MTALHLLSYGAVVAAFLFVTLAIASGLLWISELIEEHSRLAKSYGTTGIYVIIAVHVLLYLLDDLPLWRIAFSIVCHVVYLQNFSHTWPFISLSSIAFIASCVLVIADHFIWFFYFANVTHEARQASRARLYAVKAPNFGDMATFFGICIWLAPLFLFLSLSANDNALPVNTGVPSSPSLTEYFAPSHPPPARASLFSSLVQPLGYILNLRGRSGRGGIIAPPTPSFSRPSSPMPMSPTYSLNNLPPTPTRSSSFDYHLRSEVIIRAPPPRRSASSSNELLSPEILKRR